MPLESATYINQLNADWPIGKSDMVSGGDDQIRMLKSVLQNTLPNASAAFTGTPEQINNITLNTPWQDNSGTAGALSYFELTDPAKADGTTAALEVATPTTDQYNQTPGLAVTWQAIMDKVYPVGCYFTSETDNRNPADILGFGTWEARAGAIYGVGTVTDRNTTDADGNPITPATAEILPGAVAGRLFLATANMLAVDIAAQSDAIPDHQHDFTYTNYGNMDADASGSGAAGDAQSHTSQTAMGGGIPEGITTHVKFGEASEPLFSPGWGVYCWARTA